MGCCMNGDLDYNWEPCDPISRWWHLDDSVTGSRNTAIASCSVWQAQSQSPSGSERAGPGEAWQTESHTLLISFSTSYLAIQNPIAIKQPEQLISCGQLIDMSFLRKVVCLSQVYVGSYWDCRSCDTFQHSLLYQVGIRCLSKGEIFHMQLWQKIKVLKCCVPSSDEIKGQ